MGRHRNDPRGLARLLIIGLAVALAVALILVGGIALVSSLNSSSDKPGAAAQGGDTKKMSSQTDKKEGYGEIRLLAKAQLLGQAPGNGTVYLQGDYDKGDVRPLLWPDLDLTIYNPRAVRLTVAGQPVSLPPQGPANLRFRGGKLLT